MFLGQSFVTLLNLALAVAANAIVVRDNIVTIPFAKQVNLTGSANLVQLDQARAKALKDRARLQRQGKFVEAVGSLPSTNEAVRYTASVGVGSPATAYNLIVDTGSSNTWIGADKHHGYTPTSTSKETPNTVFVPYPRGSLSGTEYTDQVTLGSLVIKDQSIGVADLVLGFGPGFEGIDGILGLGPVALTLGTLKPARSQTVPTVTDNLFKQGTISQNSVAISFAPTTTDPNTNGELTFGGVDPSKFTGPINYTPVTTSTSGHWEIAQTITYGSMSILGSTTGVVDTGTTNILIPSDAFSKYQHATGGVIDAVTGLLRITQAQFNNLQPLNFAIGAHTYTLTPNAQIWPRSLNTAIGGSASAIYLIVANLGSSPGPGINFINGKAFLERFYSVFDTGNKRIGLATTQFTTATTN